MAMILSAAKLARPGALQAPFRNHCEILHANAIGYTWCVNIYELGIRVVAVRGLKSARERGEREMAEGMYYSANNLRESGRYLRMSIIPLCEYAYVYMRMYTEKEMG